jgi:hypothetical protein
MLGHRLEDRRIPLRAVRLHHRERISASPVDHRIDCGGLGPDIVDCTHDKNGHHSVMKDFDHEENNARENQNAYRRNRSHLRKGAPMKSIRIDDREGLLGGQLVRAKAGMLQVHAC